MNINNDQERLVRKVINSGKRKRFIEMLFWAVLLVAVIWFNTSSGTVGTESNLLRGANPEALDSIGLVVITKVVDGDTFHYEKNGVKSVVRMMGIDTPETVDPRKPVQCFGQASSAETKRLLEGKTVILKKDSLESGVDRYNRQLLYVYLVDGTFVNEYLVAEGYAYATPQYKFDMKDHFVDLENKARIAEKGLWNPKVCQ